jgi:hypothetical protein
MRTQFNLLPQELQNRINNICAYAIMSDMFRDNIAGVWDAGCHAHACLTVKNDYITFEVNAQVCDREHQNAEVCMEVHIQEEDIETIYNFHMNCGLLIRGCAQD